MSWSLGWGANITETAEWCPCLKSVETAFMDTDKLSQQCWLTFTRTELCFSVTYPSSHQGFNEIIYHTLFSVRCIYYILYVLPRLHWVSKLQRAFVCPLNLVCSVVVQIQSMVAQLFWKQMQILGYRSKKHFTWTTITKPGESLILQYLNNQTELWTQWLFPNRFSKHVIWLPMLRKAALQQNNAINIVKCWWRVKSKKIVKKSKHKMRLYLAESVSCIHFMCIYFW